MLFPGLDGFPIPPQSAPTAGAVISNYCPEEVQKSILFDRFAFVHLNRSCRGISLSLIDDALGIGRDRIVDEDVDMVFGSQERTNITVEYEIRQFGALDGLTDIGVSSMH